MYLGKTLGLVANRIAGSRFEHNGIIISLSSSKDRYIYGIGGNREAASLSGVNVQKIFIGTFTSMGCMAALGGILYTSKLAAATPKTGNGFELDTIAFGYIAGVSTTGGIGNVINSVVGAFVIMSLTNGLNLIGAGISYQYIIKGIIFVIAVALDVYGRSKKRS